MNNYRDKRSDNSSYNRNGGRARSYNRNEESDGRQKFGQRNNRFGEGRPTVPTARATARMVPVFASTIAATATTISDVTVTTITAIVSMMSRAIVPVSARMMANRVTIVPQQQITLPVAKNTTAMAATESLPTATVHATVVTMPMQNTAVRSRYNTKRLLPTPTLLCV